MNPFDPFEVSINQLAKYNTNTIIDQILMYWEVLDIGYENSIQVADIGAIFIKGINLQKGINHAMEQIETNSEQYLSIRYKKNGQQFTLKSFGKIVKLDRKKIHHIIKFTLLVKMLNQLNSAIALSSDIQYLEKEIKII